jgi:hypothetical protein
VAMQRVPRCSFVTSVGAATLFPTSADLSCAQSSECVPPLSKGRQEH